MSIPASADQTLEHLLDRVARKDVAAFERLYKRMLQPLHRQAWLLLREEQAAEDVVVMTMTEVWKSAARFEGRSAAATWIIQIGRNLALMELRKRRQHEDLAEFAEVLESAEPGPLQLVASAQTRQSIEQCLQRLSGVHRECVYLSLVEGRTNEEVAERQAVPVGTIKSRLHNAVRALRKCLGTLTQQRPETPRGLQHG